MKKIKDKVCINHLPLLWSLLGRGFGLWVLASVFVLILPQYCGTGKSFAQQLPFSSQYYTNPFVINPAYTGINENINVFVTHRSQWTGLAGAPQTSYFTVDGPVQAKNSSLGLKIYSDVTDIISRSGAFVNYSYKFKISDSNNLYVGIACGVLNNKIDFSKALITDNDDPFLSQQSQNKTIFSADLGVVYIWKRLVLGFAVPQVLGNRIKYPILNGDNGYYNLNRHYQGSIKYTFDVSKEKHITAYPLIMFRSVKGAPFQYDINGVLDWKKIGWVGLTYHSNYAVAISGGVRYHNFCVGYAYDIGISKIRSYTGSTSEFLLGYTFGQTRKELDRFVQTEGTKTDSLTHVSKPDDNQALLAQLKAISDTNRAEINRLKSELETAKTAEKTAPTDKGQNDANATAFITSRLVDEQGNPINDAQIEVIDKSTNQVVGRHQITNDGHSRISVPSGKNVDLVFTKPGYLFKSINLAIPDSVGYEKDLRDITMQKVEVGKKLVLNNIGFDLNQSTLRKESFSELDNSVKLMTDIPSLEMEISGHTDNIGSGKANQQLSEQRAKAVMDYIISKGGDKNRLTYKGYGSSQPLASNNTEEGRKINRRTEFKVLKVDPGYTIVSGTNTSNVGTITDNTLPPVMNAEKDAMVAQLKAKSDNNQAEIDQLKSELAKIKASEATSTNAGKVVDSLLYMNQERLLTAFSTENDSLRNQLKAKSDVNQRQMDQLKAELEKVKTLGAISPNAGKATDSLRSTLSTETVALLAQLKAKSDENQAQIDLLKEELAKAKTTEAPANTKNDELIAQLKAKSDNYQAQIDLLKEELAKTKEEVANANALNSKNAELTLQKQKTGETSQPNIVTTSAGVRTSKTVDFMDENGNPVSNGFYVIIGTFGNKENADRFKAANIIKGHGNTKMIQNQFTKTYNIFVLKTNNKADADAERIKYQVEYPSVWILQLE